MNSEELSKKIRRCKKCPLHKSRINAVGARTDGRNCNILFIGEAPGADEDKEGRPFVGRSGKLLQKTLDEIGIKDYAITNTVKCRPPSNRNPTDEEIAKCSLWLDEELKTLKPKIIVPLGSVAMHHLTDINIGILKASGKMHKDKYFPIPHPSYYLRNPHKQPSFKHMMKKLSKLIK